MGMPGRFDEPAFVDALRTVSAATEAAGKAAGILLRSAADVPRYLELGYRFIGIGSDLNFVIDATRALSPPSGASHRPRRARRGDDEPAWIG